VSYAPMPQGEVHSSLKSRLLSRTKLYQ